MILTNNFQIFHPKNFESKSQFKSTVQYLYYRNEDHSCPPNKKKKTDEDINQLTPGASTTSPSAILTPKTLQLNGANDQLRRSNRRQKARGEKEYLVDSTMLLRDLKVKVIS